MCIDLKNNIVVKNRINNNTWEFENKPEFPLLECGETFTIGWDIPTRSAVDSSGQQWEDNGHGFQLKKVDHLIDHGDACRYTAKEF